MYYQRRLMTMMQTIISDRAEGIDGSFDDDGLSALSEFSEGDALEKPLQDPKNLRGS